MDRAELRQQTDRIIARIDDVLSAQVAAILRQPRLQQLEALWRGTRWLVEQAGDERTVRVRILHLPWQELKRDQARVIEFDQSELFRKVYEEEFGTPNGRPFGLLIGAYEIDHRSVEDVETLKGVAGVAMAAFAPFVAQASAALLGLDSFTELAHLADTTSIGVGVAHPRWRALRDLEESRFLGLVLPRVLIRGPYGDDPARADGFMFRDPDHGVAGRGTLWGPAVFAFGAVAIRTFRSTGWFVEMRGTPEGGVGGGLLAGLPTPDTATDAPGVAPRLGLEVRLSETTERQLAELGLIAFVPAYGTTFATLLSNQSLHAIPPLRRANERETARINAMLQYLLSVSRFAHCVKVMYRDRIGSFATPEACERALQTWIDRYCNAVPSASPELRAQYPLREAKVRVRELAGRPGSYRATVEMRPAYQLDDLVSDFRLVAELAA